MFELDARLKRQRPRLVDSAMQSVVTNDLVFCTWHQADERIRAQLRQWVWTMRRARDREDGAGPDGASAWLDGKLAVSSSDSLYQTFIALYRDDVVWTGSVVSDDRGLQQQFAQLGYQVAAFFGLFNTRHDLRGRGVGWAGARYVNDFVVRHGNPTLGLITGNPAAERHYVALGFVCIPELEPLAHGTVRRLLYRQQGQGRLGA